MVISSKGGHFLSVSRTAYVVLIAIYSKNKLLDIVYTNVPFPIHPIIKYWVSKFVRNLIDQTNIRFVGMQYRELSKQVKNQLKLAKYAYKDKI